MITGDSTPEQMEADNCEVVWTAHSCNCFKEYHNTKESTLCIEVRNMFLLEICSSLKSEFCSLLLFHDIPSFACFLSSF